MGARKVLAYDFFRFLQLPRLQKPFFASFLFNERSIVKTIFCKTALKTWLTGFIHAGHDCALCLALFGNQ